MNTLPLQIIDSFLLKYNVGDALLVIFALGFIGALVVVKSRKALLLHVVTFGLILFLTPASALGVEASGSHFLASNLQYKLVGLALLTLGPVLYTTS